MWQFARPSVRRRLPANPSVVFKQSVALEGTSVAQRSLAEWKRGQLLTPSTFSCRTAQTATIPIEADSLPLARQSAHLFIVALKPAFGSNAEALSILHPRSMLKFATSSATVTISYEARTRVENETNILPSERFLVANSLRDVSLTGAPSPGAPVMKINQSPWPAYLACAAIAFSICALTASRLKLAPFCIGGYSIAVWATLATSFCTNWKRQNSKTNQL